MKDNGTAVVMTIKATSRFGRKVPTLQRNASPKRIPLLRTKKFYSPGFKQSGYANLSVDFHIKS